MRKCRTGTQMYLPSYVMYTHHRRAANAEDRNFCSALDYTAASFLTDVTAGFLLQYLCVSAIEVRVCVSAQFDAKKERKEERFRTASDRKRQAMRLCGLGLMHLSTCQRFRDAHWQRRGKRGRARTRDVQNVTASAADRVSSLCYQGDGEYTALEELFEARGGKLTFGGTLTRVHDCGEVNLPITFNDTHEMWQLHMDEFDMYEYAY